MSLLNKHFYRHRARSETLHKIEIGCYHPRPHVMSSSSMPHQTLPQQSPLHCSICSNSTELIRCEGGYICNECLEKNREGRDETTRAVRQLQRAQRLKTEIARHQMAGKPIEETQLYVAEASDVLAQDAMGRQQLAITGPGNELLRPEMAAELNVGSANVISLEASTERIALISCLGQDTAAMALDAAEAAGAENSLEKMLAHQIAVAHHQALTLLSKANLEADPTHQIRLSGLATKWMTTSQTAMLTLKKLRSGGEQRITIQHVNVTSGGQAVIGEVNSREGGTRK